MQVTSPDTLKKRERYSRIGSKQTVILVYVRVGEGGVKKGVSVCRVLYSDFFVFNSGSRAKRHYGF